MIEKLAYTVAEAASATGLSRRSVYREIDAGNLVARKRGSNTLILARDLEAFLIALPRIQPISGGE